MDLMTTTLRAAMQIAQDWTANQVADERPVHTLAGNRPLHIRKHKP